MQKWGNKLEPEIVISTRIRIARNFSEVPFPIKMNEVQANCVINRVKESIFASNSGMASTFTFMDINELNNIEKQVLVEKHLISPDLASKTRGSAVIVSKDEKISIMINEEDHLRIQCMSSGMQLEETWALCAKVDALLEEKNEFAFDKQYGYLTSCPTNIGTGIRASVMLHLPALVMTGYINNILDACAKIGLACRGIYGENSEPAGNMFQISNQKTLGQTEEGIISNIHNIAVQIIEQENNLRQGLLEENKLLIEDRIMRAYGILTNARIISSEEFLKLLSDVRMGVDMGMIEGVSIEKLNKIAVDIQPGNIQMLIGLQASCEQRDIHRAKIIRETLR